VAELADAPA